MDIEGTYTLHATPAEVWRCLLDPQVLQQLLPGIERIEQTTEQTYTVVLNVKRAPLSGSYQALVTISEQQYPYHYRISVEGEGRQGTFHGAGSIALNEQQNTTVIAYKGAISLKKESAALSPSLVKGAVKLLIQQFFTALADRLRNKSVSLSAEKTIEVVATQRGVAGNVILLPSHEKSVEPTDIFQRIVHLLGLGAGEQALELLWAQRLRRVSFLSILLLLVWIGTRLPRRRSVADVH